MKHEKFTYKSLDDVKAKCKELGVTIPFADNTECLSAPIRIGNREIPNRLGIAPMEGADSTPDGKPSDYTEKRYTREAAGGAGIIWYEAISIVEEGRSSRTQLLLTRETLDSFKRLNEKVKEADFLLFYLGWDRFWGTDRYFGDYPCLDEEVLSYIIKGGYKGIGFDVMGIDPINDETLRLHKKLFADKQIVNIENLKNLHLCGDELFWFSCFPLKIPNADGSPIRAVAWLE